MADGFRWCNSCGACLPEAAARCRFCGGRKGAGERLSAASALNGVRKYSDACKWLPLFPEMCTALPAMHLKHMLAVAFEAETEEMKSMPPVDVLIGYQLPPEAAVRDLILLVLLNLAGTPSFERFSHEDRLALIDLTANFVQEERQRRQCERDSGATCPQCAEYVLPDAVKCRFCQTELPSGAFPEPDKNAVDETYLRQIILQIVARVRMNAAPQSIYASAINEYLVYMKQAHQRFMQEYSITEDELLQEMTRLSNSFCPSWEEELPETIWETKLIEANQPYKRTQYGVIRNILGQATACCAHSRFDEADQLVQFAAGLAKERETDEFLSDFMYAECLDVARKTTVAIQRRSADALAKEVYDDDDPVAPAANLVKAMQETGFAFMSSGLTSPDLLKELMAGSEDDRVKALDRIKGYMKEAAELISKQLEQTSPESASKIREIIDGAAEAVDASTLSVRARGAFTRGDYATAEQLARRALSGLTSNNSVVVLQRAIQYCFLAEVYTQQCKYSQAASLLVDAVAIASRMPDTEAYNRSVVFRQVAAGFEKLAQADSTANTHLEAAKRYYEQSIADCEAGIRDVRASFPGVKFTGDLASLLAVYAGVLKKLGLHAEAANAEARAAELKPEQ